MFGRSLSRLSLNGFLGSTARPVAIDFGTTSLKVLQLSDDNPATILAAVSLATPAALLTDGPKRFAFQIEQLPALLKSANIRGQRAVASIPNWACSVRHLQVGGVDQYNAAAMTTSMLAGELNCDPSALMCRPVLVRGANAGGSAGTGKAEIIAMATGVGIVQRIMDALRAARMRCVGIHPTAAALTSAFEYMTARDTDASLVSLYVDLGGASTTVTIAHGRDLCFAKTIDLGGHFIDQSVAQATQCSVTEASERRLTRAQAYAMPPVAVASGVPASNAKSPSMSRPMTVGAGAPSAVGGGAASSGTGGAMPHLDAAMNKAQAGSAEDRRGANASIPVGCAKPEGEIDREIAEPLGVIADEVRLCLRYHDALFPGIKIGRAIFVGGEARHTGMCQHIAKALRLPAHVADPLARFARKATPSPNAVDLAKPQPGWAVCAGLAMGPTDL